MNEGNFNGNFFPSDPEDVKDESVPAEVAGEQEENIQSGYTEADDSFEQVPDYVFSAPQPEYDAEEQTEETVPTSEPQEYFTQYTAPQQEPVDYTQPQDSFAQQDVFNPYAPKNPEETPVQQPISPAYTQINQPEYNSNQNTNYGGQFYQVPNYSSQTPPQFEHPKKSKGKTVVAVILAVCFILAGIGMITGLISGNNLPADETTVQQGAVNGEVTTETSTNFEVATTQPVTQVVNSVYVADKVRPSVVGVMTYAQGKLAGEGSGVLMSEKDGWTYIVTCAHVISESGVSYRVLLLDGRSFEAELVAYDERTDIGVVKVQQTGLPLAEFGDSTTLKIGEPVYAIGNPGGSEYFGSITNGIVSAIDRSVASTYTMTCIQHNAAINPGNSGGALVNAAGQVIGINSSKIASTEYEGMGFAVPTSIAKPVVDALIEYKYVPNRPKLGIEYAPVSSYQLYSLVVSIKGLPQGSLVIAGISEDSSLAGTQAQVGDLIIAVNGKNMDDTSVLLDLIETGAVGDTLTLTLCRIESRTYKTSTFDVTITLVEDKGKTQTTEAPATEYQDDGYYRGGAGSFEDFFNDYFGW